MYKQRKEQHTTIKRLKKENTNNNNKPLRLELDVCSSHECHWGSAVDVR